MRARSILSEAGRNIATGTSRLALLALVLTATVGTVVVADARAVVDVLADAAAYRAAGAAVHIVEANGDVHGGSCEALASHPGVTASGAVRLAAPIRAQNYPASDLQTWEATPGMTTLLAPQSGARSTAQAGAVHEPGLWLSADLASTLGATRAGTLTTTAGAATVAGAYPWPSDGRDRALAYSVLSPVPAQGMFDQCWAEVWPADEEVASLMFTTLSPGTSSKARLTQLNSSLGTDFDAPQLLQARVTRHAPLITAVVGLLLGWAAVRTRRLEIASALHARTPASALALQHLLEALAWVVTASALIAGAAAWAATEGSPEPALTTWLTAMRGTGVAALTALLGTLLGVAATREKHLFRYFKNR